MLKITLKAARVNVGLLQREAAKSIGVRRETLVSWENGKTFPNPEQIEALCALYGVNYDNIIFLSKSSLCVNS